MFIFWDICTFKCKYFTLVTKCTDIISAFYCHTGRQLVPLCTNMALASRVSSSLKLIFKVNAMHKMYLAEVSLHFR